MISYNEQFQQTFGYSQLQYDEASKWWNEKIHPNDRKQVLKILDTALKEGRDRVEMNYRYKDVEGDYKFISDKAYILKDGQQKPVRILGVMQDLTDLKKKERKATAYRKAIFYLATNSEVMQGKDINNSVKEIIGVASEVLGVKRVSFWTLEQDLLNCKMIVEKGDEKNFKKSVLNGKIAPRYFEQIEHNRILAVEDAVKDKRMSELTEIYLQPNNIQSLLNTTVRIAGNVKAVIFFEEIEKKQKWEESELNFAGSVADLAAMIFTNAEKNKKEEQLKISLEEKEVLLQEVHHRVKNNLAVLSGLIELQAMEEEDEKVRYKLKNTSTRIAAIASIHEILYGTENLSCINISKNTEELSKRIIQTMQSEARVSVNIKAKKIYLNINQVVPFSLIFNEVMTNIMKHAFGKSEYVHISIRLEENKEEVELTVSDNGIGLPADFNEKQHQSLGIHLIEILTKQLNGSHEFTGTNSGSRFSLKFQRNHVNGAHSSNKLEKIKTLDISLENHN